MRCARLSPRLLVSTPVLVLVLALVTVTVTLTAATTAATTTSLVMLAFALARLASMRSRFRTRAPVSLFLGSSPVFGRRRRTLEASDLVVRVRVVVVDVLRPIFARWLLFLFVFQNYKSFIYFHLFSIKVRVHRRKLFFRKFTDFSVT